VALLPPYANIDQSSKPLSAYFPLPESTLLSGHRSILEPVALRGLTSCPAAELRPRRSAGPPAFPNLGDQLAQVQRQPALMRG
jgi:hypothetical protein